MAPLRVLLNGSGEATYNNERFVFAHCTVDYYIQIHDNKNTISKAKRVVSLLKRFLDGNNEQREIEKSKRKV